MRASERLSAAFSGASCGSSVSSMTSAEASIAESSSSSSLSSDSSDSDSASAFGGSEFFRAGCLARFSSPRAAFARRGVSVSSPAAARRPDCASLAVAAGLFEGLARGLSSSELKDDPEPAGGLEPGAFREDPLSADFGAWLGPGGALRERVAPPERLASFLRFGLPLLTVTSPPRVRAEPVPRPKRRQAACPENRARARAGPPAFRWSFHPCNALPARAASRRMKPRHAGRLA